MCRPASLRVLVAAACIASLRARRARGRQRFATASAGRRRAAEIAGWDIDVRPDGTGLPEGRGTRRRGPGDLRREMRVAATARSARAPTTWRSPAAWDRSRRTRRCARPAASSTTRRRCSTTSAARCRSTRRSRLTPDEVYALTAYVLNLNDILPADAVLDRRSLVAGEDAESRRLHDAARLHARGRQARHACNGVHDELRGGSAAARRRFPNTRAIRTATSPSRRVASHSDAPTGGADASAAATAPVAAELAASAGCTRVPRRSRRASSVPGSATSRRRYRRRAGRRGETDCTRCRPAAPATGAASRCRPSSTPTQRCMDPGGDRSTG